MQQNRARLEMFGKGKQTEILPRVPLLGQGNKSSSESSVSSCTLRTALRCSHLLNTEWKKVNFMYLKNLPNKQIHGKEEKLVWIWGKSSPLRHPWSKMSWRSHHRQFLLLSNLHFSYLQHRKGHCLDKLLCSKSCISGVLKVLSSFFKKMNFPFCEDTVDC